MRDFVVREKALTAPLLRCQASSKWLINGLWVRPDLGLRRRIEYQSMQAPPRAR